MATPDPMIACLGLPHDDPGIMGLLRRFAITRTPTVERDAFEEPADAEISSPQDWVSNLARGIEFGFEDEAAFTGEPPDVWGLGPMLLTQIYLYADHPEAATYEGALPFGLDHGDDRAGVRAKLDPQAKERRSRDLDSWSFEGFMVTAGYLDNGKLSFIVLLFAPPKPPLDPGLAAICPTPDQILGILGASIHDERLKEVLRPLGHRHRYQRRGEDLAIMDLRDDFGTYFEFEPSEEITILSRVLLLGDQRFGSAIWPGPLPGGLRFGAGWSDILERVGRLPDGEAEADFILYADWQSDRHVTRIEYSTMTNELLAISMHLAASVMGQIAEGPRAGDGRPT